MSPSFLRRPLSDQTSLLLLLIPVLAVNIACGIHILQLVSRQSILKEDYADVNSIGNGLLSVEVWKTHIANLTSEKLSHFNLKPKQEAEARTAIATVLKALIGEMDKIMHQPQKTLRGKVRRLAFKVLVDSGTLTEQAPDYAGAILEEIKKPENMEKIKELALSQIQGAEEAAGPGGGSPLKGLLDKYHATNVEDFNHRVEGQIHDYQNIIRLYASVMIGSVFLFLAVWWQTRDRRDLHKPLYALSVTLAFILLTSALALPMIDIDARINHVDFLLLGEHLQFTNQLLFYRSKSIMQMVTILMTARKAETILVGFLILLFSIIFPITKLVSTLLCLFGGEKLKNQPVVHFFAYESGKWSMADVLVVAIFMAYIGFNSVLNGQLKHLNFQTQAVGAIATNQTALQPGFVLFLAFVLYGLALSTILKKIDI